MRKRVKGVCTLLLAGALVASLVPGLPSARAATAVDTSRECSLEISVGAQFDDLAEQEVLVNLYKVADVDASGKYTSVGAFSEMTFGYIEDSEGAADDWNELAASAAKIAVGSTDDADGTGDADNAGAVDPDVVVTVPAGSKSAVQEGLSTGLYLVVPQEVTAENYTYTFTPSLVSFPNNYYYKTGDDAWVYDLVDGNAIELKPSQEERLGSIQITKELTDYSQTAGDRATFVFEITYTTPKGVTNKVQEVMAFTGAGTQDLTVSDIPAGSTVTVEEIYSGAAYTVTGDSDGGEPGTVTVTAVADDTVEATITNSHNDSPNGGYGIVNEIFLEEYGENSQYKWDGNTEHYNTGGGSVTNKVAQPATVAEQTDGEED